MHAYVEIYRQRVSIKNRKRLFIWQSAINFISTPVMNVVAYLVRLLVQLNR
jgi:hypothetical protein